MVSESDAAYFSTAVINPLPPSDAVREQKKNLKDHFSSVLLRSKKNITPLET